MVLRPASGDGPNVTLQADIVLNGGSDLYSAPWPSADTCACVALVSLVALSCADTSCADGSSFAMDNVLISANYHACGPQCPAADANCTEGRLNGMPQSGTLIIASYGVTIEANSLYQFGDFVPSQHPGPEGPSGCRVPNPLVVAGTHSGFYARDVRLSTATGWDSEQGYAYLYGDPAKAEERLFLETWESDGPTTRTNLLNSTLLAAPSAAAGLAPVPHAMAGPTMDGHATVSLQADGAAAMLLASVPLASWPSIAGRALFAAVDVRVAAASTQVGLAIDSGDGVWRNSSKGYVQPAGNWSRVTFQCVAAKSGELRVALQLFGDNARVEVGAGAIGVVGAGWSRLVEASPLGLPA